MRIYLFTIGLVVATAVALVGCSGDDDKAATSTGAPAATGAAPSEATKAGGPTSPGAPAVAAGSAKLPSDACALLTLQEVQTVAPSATKGEGKTEKNGAISSVNCYWAPTGSDLNSVNVTVTTLPASRDQVKLSLQVEARDQKENGAEVAGLGDFAVFVSSINADAEVKGIVKGLFLSVDLNGIGARGQKEKVIALAKAAAGRIQ